MQVGCTHPLDGGKRRGVGGQHRRHTRHGQPHEHLVTGDHTQSGHQTTRHATFAGGGDERQIARPGNGQKQHNRSDKCAIVRDAKEHAKLSKQKG
jgi:hypothetical protein